MCEFVHGRNIIFPKNKDRSVHPESSRDIFEGKKITGKTGQSIDAENCQYI
jgi:hypothetical protein